MSIRKNNIILTYLKKTSFFLDQVVQLEEINRILADHWHWSDRTSLLIHVIKQFIQEWFSLIFFTHFIHFHGSITLRTSFTRWWFLQWKPKTYFIMSSYYIKYMLSSYFLNVCKKWSYRSANRIAFQRTLNMNTLFLEDNEIKYRVNSIIIKTAWVGYLCKINIPKLSALKFLQQQFKLLAHFKIHKAHVVHSLTPAHLLSQTYYFLWKALFYVNDYLRPCVSFNFTQLVLVTGVNERWQTGWTVCVRSGTFDNQLLQAVY